MAVTRGRPHGSKNKTTANIRNAIEKAFHRINNPEINGNGVSWLEHQAWNNPAVFAGLVAKVIPNEVKLDVSHTINLGDAMSVAAERIKQLEHDNNVNLLDITPKPMDNITNSSDAEQSSETSKTSKGGMAGGTPED